MKYLSVPLEVKSLDDDGKVARYEGYAATFGNVDRVNEYFVKGAFPGISAKMIPLLWNHEGGEQIGAHKSIAEDDAGLFVKAELNLGVRRGAEAYALMRADHLSTMSVGYRVNEDAWDPEKRARALKKVTLMEISLAPIPANIKARVTAVKSLEGELISLSEFKTFLREVGGLSISEAECVIAKGYGQLLKEKRAPLPDYQSLVSSFKEFQSTLKGLSP